MGKISQISIAPGLWVASFGGFINHHRTNHLWHLVVIQGGYW